VLAARGDTATGVVVDPSARYFGTPLGDTSLVTILDSVTIAPTRFADWLARRTPKSRA